MHSQRTKQGKRKQMPIAVKLSLAAALSSLCLAASVNTASAWGVSGALSWAKAQLRTQMQNDVMKTAVAQDAIGSSVVAETIMLAKQKQAVAEANLQKKENLLDLYNNYIGKSALTNSSRCVAVNTRKNEVNVPLKSKLYVKADLTNSLNTGNFRDESSRLAALQGLKNSVACTLEQAAQGYCTPSLSGGQYYDSDFGMYLASDRLMDTQFIAAKAGVMTIADPLPDQKTINDCDGDTACSAQIAQQNSRIAVNSLINNSLLTQLYNRMAVGADSEN